MSFVPIYGAGYSSQWQSKDTEVTQTSDDMEKVVDCSQKINFAKVEDLKRLQKKLSNYRRRPFSDGVKNIAMSLEKAIKDLQSDQA